MNFQVNYPSDYDQFLKELLEGDKPTEILIKRNLDFEYLENFIIKTRAGLRKISLDDYELLLEENSEIQAAYNLRRKKSQVIELIEKYLTLSKSIVGDFKERFNPDFPTYFMFFKCFFDASLTSFSDSTTNKKHIKAIEKQALIFGEISNELKGFFLDMLWSEILEENKDPKYTERLFFFNKKFKERFGNDLTPVHNPDSRIISDAMDQTTIEEKETAKKHNPDSRIISDAMDQTTIKEKGTAKKHNPDSRIISDAMDQTTIEEKGTAKKHNPEFTTARQIMTIYYLLQYGRINVGEIDRTKLARFSQFLTGKDYTSIYKRWANPLGKLDTISRYDKGNFDFIKEQFSELGLEEIVKMIENDALPDKKSKI